MSSAHRKLIFVGNARDFHGMDWYRTIRKVCPDLDIVFATDLIDSEGHRRLVTDEDRTVNLFNVDRFLLRRQSRAGNVWRNLVKFLALPEQVRRLKQIARENPEAIYHAHTMYYMWMCWLAGLRFIGTPQGDEILIRPHRSRLYRALTARALRAADHLIVDSANLQTGIKALSGRQAAVIQYGIDAAAIRGLIDPALTRTSVASIRALYPLYRIDAILDSRDATPSRQPLCIFYPFWEASYRADILARLTPDDRDLGRFDSKPEMYRFLNSVALAVSVPASDSSPRSVYESIFCGCAVVVAPNPFIDDLPDCMRARVIVADLERSDWLAAATSEAARIVATPYIPSERALDMFDQDRSMRHVANRYYRI